MEKIKSGVDGVDELLSGGFPKGKIVMVSGSSGCGKTIFLITNIFSKRINDQN